MLSRFEIKIWAYTQGNIQNNTDFGNLPGPLHHGYMSHHESPLNRHTMSGKQMKLTGGVLGHSLSNFTDLQYLEKDAKSSL